MNKREEILKSALTLFSKEGYDSVGIQRIVESVAVTKPTLYHHFGSKQGLLDSVLDYYYTPYLEGFKSRCEYHGDIVKSLESVAEYCFDFAKNNSSVHLFILTLIFSPIESEAGSTAKRYIDRHHKLLENMFLAAEEDHGNMKGRSFNFTVTFMGMINSYISSYFNGRYNLDKQEVYQSCRQFMYGIFS